MLDDETTVEGTEGEASEEAEESSDEPATAAA